MQRTNGMVCVYVEVSHEDDLEFSKIKDLLMQAAMENVEDFDIDIDDITTEDIEGDADDNK